MPHNRAFMPWFMALRRSQSNNAFSHSVITMKSLEDNRSINATDTPADQSSDGIVARDGTESSTSVITAVIFTLTLSTTYFAMNTGLLTIGITRIASDLQIPEGLILWWVFVYSLERHVNYPLFSPALWGQAWVSVLIGIFPIFQGRFF